ncbi:MAG TPA: response regulator [Vicinamibacterales bacterium]|nr:response regulator [Vicinamibacterales bacterium]
MHAPVVFVVDDDPGVRGYLERLVRSVGLACEAFGTADEFVAHVGDQHFGCAILDVRMPGTSGLDAQQVLVDRGVPLPVIFVTGYADVAVAVRAMKAGAVDVFVKPVNGQDLLDSVHRAIELDRRRLEALQERRRLELLQETLTPREREVMALVVTGLANKHVATTLGTTLKTIKTHRARVMRKMQADSLADLVRIADRLGRVVTH